MSLERTGLVEEAQQRREKWAHMRYIAPHDRLPKPPPEPKPAPAPRKRYDTVPALRERIAKLERVVAVLKTPPGECIPDISAVQSVFIETLVDLGYAVDGVPYDARHLAIEQRRQCISWPRQVCILLADQLCRPSLHQLGKGFDRDHSTCLNAIRRAPHQMTKDPLLAEAYAKVLARFGAAQ